MRGKKIILLTIFMLFIVSAGMNVYAAESEQASADRNSRADAAATAQGQGSVGLKSTFGESLGAGALSPSADSGPSPRILRVLSLIETKTDDQKVLKQIRHKLTNMGEERLGMITSLSERIISKGQEAESEVAFLLLTALIIFS
ncbi:MAG: hypothetical protein WA610_02285 [Thermodesulfovibrionales bacterium]